MFLTILQAVQGVCKGTFLAYSLPRQVFVDKEGSFLYFICRLSAEAVVFECSFLVLFFVCVFGPYDRTFAAEDANNERVGLYGSRRFKMPYKR
jgi:hypothetical protein